MWNYVQIESFHLHSLQRHEQSFLKAMGPLPSAFLHTLGCHLTLAYIRLPGPSPESFWRRKTMEGEALGTGLLGHWIRYFDPLEQDINPSVDDRYVFGTTMGDSRSSCILPQGSGALTPSSLSQVWSPFHCDTHLQLAGKSLTIPADPHSDGGS